MSLKVDNLTRAKWKIASFPKMLNEIERLGKKQSDLFPLSNHFDAKFAMFFGRESPEPGFNLGVVMKEYHEDEDLDLNVKFWVEDDVGDKMRNWKARNCVFRKVDYTCKVSLRIRQLYVQGTERIAASPTFYCELSHTTPTDHILVPKSYLLLRQSLWKYHQKGEETQITIRTDKREFKVGRDVLISQSDVFASMFSSSNYMEGQTGIIELEDFQPEIVECFIKWLYLGEIDKEELADELFALADKYLIEELKTQCSTVMSSTLDDKNVIRRLVCAIKFDKPDLKSEIFEYLVDKDQADCMKMFMSPVWLQFALEDEERASKSMEEFYEMI